MVRIVELLGDFYPDVYKQSDKNFIEVNNAYNELYDLLEGS